MRGNCSGSAETSLEANAQWNNGVKLGLNVLP